MGSEDTLPLRWAHFREGLYFIEARSPDAAIAELETLLDARAAPEVSSRPQGLTG